MTNNYNKIIIIITTFAITIFVNNRFLSPTVAAEIGKWEILQESIGVSAMHMQVLHTDKVVVFDRTDFGKSNLSLPNNQCRRNSADEALKIDCTAHSVEYDVVENKFRPLMIQTDTWCSSGSLTRDGTLAQTGGYNDGDRMVRLFKPCGSNEGCDWDELGPGLAVPRWYATNHGLPDGRQVVVGGIGQFNYEFVPKMMGLGDMIFDLPFLRRTLDKIVLNNLYPFVFLLPDGNLFVFANNRAVLLDYSRNEIVREFPAIPGGQPRSYPSTGSAVLLPLKMNKNNSPVEVLVCGGAPRGSYKAARRGKFMAALKTCGRIRVSDPIPEWEIEKMPMGRVMSDMVLLPNGKVLIINGAGSGVAGWEMARDPVLHPLLYDPESPIGRRFEVHNQTQIPRLYHSTAGLLRDGRVLVAGSNPNFGYNFENVLFPTDLSLEAFSPGYLDPMLEDSRPKIGLPVSQTRFGYGQKVTVEFEMAGQLEQSSLKTTMVSPSFTTHSFSMNQRLMELSMGPIKKVGKVTYRVDVTMPNSANFILPGFHMIFVVHKNIPSGGVWVQMMV